MSEDAEVIEQGENGPEISDFEFRLQLSQIDCHTAIHKLSYFNILREEPSIQLVLRKHQNDSIGRLIVKDFLDGPTPHLEPAKGRDNVLLHRLIQNIEAFEPLLFTALSDLNAHANSGNLLTDN
jgi:hypothetical protein